MKARKIFLSSLFAFLLSFLLVVIITTTSKKAKAYNNTSYEIDTSTTYYLNGLTNDTGLRNIISSGNSVNSFSTRTLQDDSGFYFIFALRGNIELSNVIDDALYRKYFVIIPSINTNENNQINYIRLGIYFLNDDLSYRTSSLSDGGNNHFEIYYNLKPVDDSSIPSEDYNLYWLDYDLIIDDDPLTSYIISLLQNGFNIVKNATFGNRSTGALSYLNNVPCGKINDLSYNGSQLTYYLLRSEGYFSIFNKYYDTGEQFSAGYQLGYVDGEEIGQLNGYNNGYNIGFSDGEEQGYNIGYNTGLVDGNSAFDSYSNVLSVAWSSVSTLLNTQVLGKLKIIHFLILPLALGLFLIVLKLIRG